MRRSLLTTVPVNHAAVFRPTPARLLSAKGSQIFDKELQKEEIQQINTQMEDAILKEKEVHDSEQAKKSKQTWDAASETARKPDERTQQSKTEEMDAIFNEQVKLAKENAFHGQERTPLGKQSSEFDDSSDNETMMDSVKQSAWVAAQSVKNVGHDLKEATKSSMHELKEMAKGMAKSAVGEDPIGDSSSETRKLVFDAPQATSTRKHPKNRIVSGKEMMQDLEGAMKDLVQPHREGEKSQDMTGKTDDGTDKDPGKKPRSKRFSEYRQNTSLL